MNVKGGLWLVGLRICVGVGHRVDHRGDLAHPLRELGDDMPEDDVLGAVRVLSEAGVADNTFESSKSSRLILDVR